MDKSKPRSFSVKGPYYWLVRAHCEREKIDMRTYITRLIVQDLGEPGQTKPPEKEVHVSSRPTFMQPPAEPKKQEEVEGPPGYTPPIQHF